MNTLKDLGHALIDIFSQQKLLVFVDHATGVPVAHRCEAGSFAWEGDTLVLDTGERILNGFVQAGESIVKPLDMPEQQFVRWYAFAHKFPRCEIYKG